MTTNTNVNRALLRACDAVGGTSALGRLIGASQQVVWGWLHKTRRGAPAEYCAAIEAVSGVSKEELRPDVFHRFTTICTADGTWLARDPVTGTTASGATAEEAIAELLRLLTARQAA